MVRTWMVVTFAGVFFIGILPPEHPWLIFIGAAGVIGTLFLPKDF